MVSQTLKTFACLLLSATAALAADPVPTRQITVDAAGNPTTTLNLGGSHVTGLNASSLSAGTVPLARLGTGTPTNGTVLRGDGSWGTPQIALTTGLIAEYRLDEGTGRKSSKRAFAMPTNNLLACPDGPFDGGQVWNGGAEITDRYALAPWGPSAVTQWSPGGVLQLGQAVPVTAGTYTLSLRTCSNTGVAQKFATNFDGNISADITVPAVGAIRVVRSVTYASAGTANLSVLYPDAAHDPNNLSFWDVQFVPGTKPEDPGDNTYLSFIGSPTWVSGGVDLSGAGNNYLIASQPRQSIRAMSVYCVMRWPTANAAPNANAALLADAQGGAGYYLCAQNGSTSPTWTIGGSTLYAPLCNLHDGNAHLVAATSDGSSLSLYIDGVQVASSAQSAAVFQTALLQVGNLNIGGFNFPGIISYAGIYSVGHTPPQQFKKFQEIQGIVADVGLSLNLPQFVSLEGDSITAGQSVTPYANAALAGITPIVQARNYAVAGAVIGAAGDAASVNSLFARLPQVSASWQKGRRNVLFIGPLHNDLVSVDGPTFLTRLHAYCQAARTLATATGATLDITVSTPLPSTVVGFNARRATAIASMLADTSSDWQRICNFNGVSGLGADLDPGASGSTAATTNYQDGTHPNVAGNSAMAPTVTTAVQAALQ